MMAPVLRLHTSASSIVLCAVALAATASLSIASKEPSPQADATVRPSFEAASIKLAAEGATVFRYGLEPGGRWEMLNMPIATLIRSAYPAQSRDLVGAPKWVLSEPYIITAKAEGIPPSDRVVLMLQSLLLERFKFSGHYESTVQPVFALRVASGGAKDLRLSEVDCEAVRSARSEGRPVVGPRPSNGAPLCGWSGNGDEVRFGGVSMSTLAGTLHPDGRVVIDKTGLAGNYEFTLRYTTELNPTDDDRPSVFTALREQLGLTLVPDRAPLRVLVVDHIERPTPN